jgi:Ser/Thr protein kinase RdoA (MazF antagonist)
MNLNLLVGMGIYISKSMWIRNLIQQEVLIEQMKFCKYLRNSGIPFMEHVSTSKGEPFTSVKDVDKEWRFVLFEWIQGEHLTHCTESIAGKFGAFARKIHNISSKFDTEVFPKESHSKDHENF